MNIIKRDVHSLLKPTEKEQLNVRTVAYEMSEDQLAELEELEDPGDFLDREDNAASCADNAENGDAVPHDRGNVDEFADAVPDQIENVLPDAGESAIDDEAVNGDRGSLHVEGDGTQESTMPPSAQLVDDIVSCEDNARSFEVGPTGHGVTEDVAQGSLDLGVAFEGEKRSYNVYNGEGGDEFEEEDDIRGPGNKRTRTQS